jgi:hypothetical protein
MKALSYFDYICLIVGLFNDPLKGSDYISSGQFWNIEFDKVWRKNRVSFSHGGGVQSRSPYCVHSARRPLLAYCTCPGWLWWWWRIWWNEDWQGKPKYSEKTCPSATLSATDPTYQSRARTRAAAVGSQRLTAWAMARPLHVLLWGMVCCPRVREKPWNASVMISNLQIWIGTRDLSNTKKWLSPRNSESIIFRRENCMI